MEVIKRFDYSYDDIVQLEADGNYTRLRMRSGKTILSSYNLGKFDAAMPSCFVRTTRQLIINLNLASPIYYSRRRKQKSPVT